MNLVNRLGELEVVAAGRTPSSTGNGATIEADVLNALQPSRLVLNAQVRATSNQRLQVAGVGQNLVLRDGAVLRAPEVILGAVAGGKGVRVEAGAGIDTLGRGAAPLPDNAGFYYQAEGGVMVVSNGRTDLLAAPLREGADPSLVSFDIGTCDPGRQCAGQARLVSEGSINVATNGGLQLRDTASYGTRQLGVSVAAINLGSDDAIAQAAAAAALPPGMLMNQQVLTTLLRGNTATGAPALETLKLSAAESINVFGSVDLDTRDSATGKSSLRTLVLGAPAIHGYGNSSDRARIFAGNLTGPVHLRQVGLRIRMPRSPAGRRWSTALAVASWTSLPIRCGSARRHSRGPPRRSWPDAGPRLRRGEPACRTAGGLRRQWCVECASVPGRLRPSQGLDLQWRQPRYPAPLVTAEAGAKLAVTAGGTLRVHGAGASTAADALGAELTLDADDILLDTRIALASGRLAATAARSVQLGSSANLDLSGRKVSLFDVDTYSVGGDVTLTATEGDVRSDAASRVDLSAQNNRAGRLTVTALGTAGGHVDLAGRLLGQASGTLDAGGSLVPYENGELVVRARELTDFSGLNQRLTRDGVTGARSFQIKQGDLLIGDEVKARKVDISVDGGALRVLGRIDASGDQVGSIRLAARDGLQLDGSLDAHGTALRVDSYGKIIDSPNRAIVELESRDGRVQLGSAARIDLRSGTGVAVGTGAGQNDGRARGTFVLNVPRVGSDDAGVDTGSGVQVLGARDIFVTGVRRYDGAPWLTRRM
ncbi:hypothetical protein NMB32_18680 [Stenotrophomonas sp. CD2]|nr:hypothetical protein NMB32_18680 [Stenotrophomonas sp. CD2]